MANLDGLSVSELRSYLSGQVKSLKLLKTILIISIVVIVLAVVGHVIYYYNYLTNLNFDVMASQAKVETALQYRANLVPILIESVVSFVEHEDNVFNSVVDGRERSLQTPPSTLKDLEKLKKSAELMNNAKDLSGMNDLLQKVFAIAEQYPDLKTAAPFQLLMTKASDTEAEIYAQRLDMTDKINLYTTIMAMFPGNFYSTVLFSFPDYEYFSGKLYSEWPNFKGKIHSEWPNVSTQSVNDKKDQSSMKEKDDK